MGGTKRRPAIGGIGSNRGGPSPKFPWPPLPETPPAPQARIGPLPRCKREPRHRGDAGAQEQATRMGGAYPVALVTETARLLRLLISTIRWWRGVRRFTPKRFFS